MITEDWFVKPTLNVIIIWIVRSSIVLQLNNLQLWGNVLNFIPDYVDMYYWIVMLSVRTVKWY